MAEQRSGNHVDRLTTPIDNNCNKYIFIANFLDSRQDKEFEGGRFIKDPMTNFDHNNIRSVF